MSSTPSWNSIVTKLESVLDPSSIATKLLKKTTLIKMDETQLVIGCVNSGTRMILEPKRETIEKAVSQLLKKPMMVVFVTETEPAKKNPNDLPLVTFEKKKTAAVKQSGIQSRYTFENFAVSPSNQIAHAAALAIVEKPGLNYNPFFYLGRRRGWKNSSLTSYRKQNNQYGNR
jgi:chromosomal replication initiator protein